MNPLQDAINITENHLKNLKKAISEIKEKNILEDFDIEDFETVKIIDTFIFRFIKLQDYMGQKLFKRFLESIGESVEGLSFVDILDKLEKLQLISSVDRWMEIRKLRNRLTHEYPQELEEIKEEVEFAIYLVDEIENTFENIKSYLISRKIV